MAKGGAPHKASKQSLTKITKKPLKKRRKSCKQNYSTYVYRVLNQVHPSTRILSKAMNVMNPFVVDIFNSIGSEALHLIHCNKRCAILAREIQSAIRLMLPGKLAKHTVSEDTKAVTTYTNSV
ncbi:histone H2B type 2-E-like [Carcharodon carcharias]|uniref:histone H2B type 2-E-like n=1 Tax=Carcharodon carcharias TaxID=13397 RepID=UPI001B7F004F|nr:histone H2B type 2-E-like [Carcharodon carcharias]